MCLHNLIVLNGLLLPQVAEHVCCFHFQWEQLSRMFVKYCVLLEVIEVAPFLQKIVEADALRYA